jgi:hypothetical protein
MITDAKTLWRAVAAENGRGSLCGTSYCVLTSNASPLAAIHLKSPMLKTSQQVQDILSAIQLAQTAHLHPAEKQR